MTVSTASYEPTLYSGNGVTTAFSSVWPFLELTATLISALGVETLWTEGTDYTITQAAPGSTGTVTAVTAPASGTTLRLDRVTVQSQGVEMTDTGPFPAVSNETALDRLTLIAQEHAYEFVGNSDAIDGLLAGIDDMAQVASIAALRLIGLEYEPTSIRVLSWHAGLKIGGGVFVRGGTGGTDNSVSLIVDAANRNWYRVFDGPLTGPMGGAKGDATTDDTAALRLVIASAVSGVGSGATDGAFIGLDLLGLAYLESDEITITGATSNYLHIHNGKLIASAAADWNNDANGFPQKSLIKIDNFAARGRINNVLFECNHVSNGIEKTDDSGGSWIIQDNEINHAKRWGIKADGSGGDRIDRNLITEYGSGDTGFEEVEYSGARTSGSAIVTGIASTTGITAGKTVSGIGIPFDTRVLSVDSATQITLTANATSTTTGTFGVNLFTSFGIWYVGLDSKFASNTSRWCLCSLYMDTAGATSLFHDNHFYNGGSGSVRKESRIIYAAASSNSNIFVVNYFDNGIIELRGIDQTFIANRIASTGNVENSCIFRYVATSASQVFDAGKVHLFGFEMPAAVTNDTVKLVELTADTGASWNLTQAMFALDGANPNISGSTFLDIIANTLLTVRSFRSNAASARTIYENTGTTPGDAPFVGSTSNTLELGRGTTVWAKINDKGIGYPVGMGGVVTQDVSKATGVELDKPSVDITMNNAALAAATVVSFVFTNSCIAASDNLIVTHISGGTLGVYNVSAATPAAGSAEIFVRNNTAGSLSQAIVLRVTIFKAANT